MAMSGRGMAPSERGIVDRKDMDRSEDARHIAEEQDTKPRQNTHSNNQQPDSDELDSCE